MRIFGKVCGFVSTVALIGLAISSFGGASFSPVALGTFFLVTAALMLENTLIVFKKDEGDNGKDDSD